MKHPLSKQQLEAIIDSIDVEPGELVRKDPKFKELGLDAADFTTKAAVTKLLVQHPALMQRPIAVVGKRAILARPKEKILDLL